MNAITQLDVLDLEDTIGRYGVGDLIRYWPAANGIENSNYFVRTHLAPVENVRPGEVQSEDAVAENAVAEDAAPGNILAAEPRQTREREREYVLTILEQPSNAGGSYVALLDRCVDAGLPVAAVVRNLKGEAYENFDGKAALLSRRLPGRHVYNPTVKQVQALARFIGRFHLATAGWDHPVPDYPRTVQWLDQNCRQTKRYLPYLAGQLLEDTVEEVTSLLERYDVSELPRGVIHGDLFRDNVLFNERGLTGVLDFHHAAEGYLIYDLAVAANDWCTDTTGQLDTERTTALIKTYHQIRPITAAELRFFPTFTLYAALAFWLSRLSVAIRRDDAGKVRFNNPEEFQQIVAQHRAHSFYLDERLLV